MAFTHKLPVPLALPGHVSIRKGGAYGVDFAKMKANRELPKAVKPKCTKAMRLAMNAQVTRRFPGGSADSITEVGMR